MNYFCLNIINMLDLKAKINRLKINSEPNFGIIIFSNNYKNIP